MNIFSAFVQAGGQKRKKLAPKRVPFSEWQGEVEAQMEKLPYCQRSLSKRLLMFLIDLWGSRKEKERLEVNKH